MAEQGDPADWSIDRVVHEICYNKTPSWALGTDLKPVIHPEAAENALRENDIDGDNLLALKDKDLRDDLGFTSFGQRRALRNIIKHLRLVSHKYQEQHPPQTGSRVVTQPFSTPQLSHTPITPIVRSPSVTSIRMRPSIESNVVDDAITSSQGDFKQNGQHNQPADHTLTQPVNPPANHSGSILNVLSTMIDKELDDNNQQATSNLAQPPKPLQQRKKEPKRAVLIPVADGGAANVDSVFSPASVDTSMTGTSYGTFVGSANRGRDTNAFQYPAPKRLRTSGQFSASVNSGYDRHQRAKADTITTQNASLSTLRSRRSTENNLNESRDGEEHSSDFFLSTSSIDRHKLPRLARQSKHEVFAVRSWSEAQSIDKNSAVVGPPVRKPLGSFSIRDQSHEASSDLAEDLQLLLEKYPVDQSGEAMPLYGDSDEEDRMMTPEFETPPPDDRPEIKRTLTRPEIDAVIDDVFQRFRVDWRQRRLSKAQTKAHRKWMVAARNKTMHAKLLKQSKLWQGLVRDRVTTHRQGIHNSEWRKSEDVEQQCLAVEVSVHQLEEYNLYVEVLESENEPVLPAPKTPLAPRKALDPRVHRVLPNGDEDLDSESEDGDAFIVDDSDETLPDPEFMGLYESTDGWNPKFATEGDAVTQGSSVASNTQPNTMSMSTDLHSDTVDTGDASANPVQSLPTEENRQRKQAALQAAQRNPLNIPSSSASSDVDSDFERNPRLPSTKYDKEGKSKAKAIDLTGSSPSPFPDSDGHDSNHLAIRTPDLNAVDSPDQFASLKVTEAPSPAKRGNKRVLPDVDGAPLQYIEHVRALSWHEIEHPDETESPESSLALAKCIFSDSVYRAASLLGYVQSFKSIEDLVEVLQEGLEAHKEDDEEISCVDRKNQSNARLLTELLLSYATGRDLVDPDEVVEADIDDAHSVLFNGALARFRLDLLKILQTMIQYGKADPSKNDVLDETDDDIEMLDARDDADLPSSLKPRKRKVTQSQAAVLQQRADQNRVKRQEAKRAALARQNAEMGLDKDATMVAVNAEQPQVFLDPKIAAEAKPHQISGIQFVWRETVENPKRTGCLLAHTMGLGKTMQVIAVLVTIAQCKKSEDESIRDLIPDHLKGNNTLILCPMALVETWEGELDKWMPLGPYGESPLGDILTVTNKVRTPAATIQRWVDKGGVLILSYERFRSYTNPTLKSKILRDSPEVRRMLLEGPHLVIADEAHKMKNASSKITESARALTATSRIALTGSPLNNYLEEYHTMVDWISPGYLGNPVQFRSKYVEPINRGLYSDSTAWERRASLKKLHMLKKNIAPKIHRADISAIAKDMPPKTEFFITIPLTPDQAKAYQLYVEELRGASDAVKKTTNARIWSWLSVLSLLLNHPSCFIEKLKERDDVDKAVRAQIDPVESPDDGYESGETAASAENVNVQEQPALLSAMQKVMDVFLEAKVLVRIEDPSLSNKSFLIHCILEEAVKLGEKTIIFSQSIPTLNYYETLVRRMGLDYKRIDGQSTNRVNDLTRQQHVEEFNTLDKFKVFLISTRAGGLGLNIQGATRVIINDFGFNPTWEEQAVGRAYRIGQKKPVFVYRFLTGGTFEGKVHNKAVFKSQLFTRVIDKKNVMRAAARSPGEFLFNPKEVPKVNFDECLGKDPLVLDRILQRVDCVRNIVLTETYLKDDEEELTEQEIKEANKELELEQLERDDPEEFARRMEAQRAQSAAEALAAANQRQQQYSQGLQQARQQGMHAASMQSPPTSHYFTPQVVYDPKLGPWPMQHPQQPASTIFPSAFGQSAVPYPGNTTRFVSSYDDSFAPPGRQLRTLARQSSLPPAADPPRADVEMSEAAPDLPVPSSAPIVLQQIDNSANQVDDNDETSNEKEPQSAPGCRPQ